MKRIELLRGLLLAAGWALVACGGVSAIGQGEDELKVPEQVGGGYNGSVPMAPVGGSHSSSTAGRSSGDPIGVGGTASTAGSAPAAGGAPAGQVCAIDADCPNYGATCEECEDGSFACDKTFCSGNKCARVANTCNIPCRYDMECSALDKECLSCGNGSYACPVGQCVAGSCQTIVPACGAFEPCKDQPCGAMCLYVCPDGDCSSNVASFCDGKGQCQQGVPQCGNNEQCTTTMDCPDTPVTCVTCDKDTCAQFDCIAGKCVFTCPLKPEPECVNNGDCAPAMECKECPSGDCASVACLQGSCALVCPLVR